MANDVLTKLKKLDEEREKLLTEAHDEALAAANAAIASLNELGFTYQLVEGSRARSTMPSESRKGTRAIDPNKSCPICKIVTSPPHDARHKLHRAQGQNKKPLTDQELQQAGLIKVA